MDTNEPMSADRFARLWASADTPDAAKADELRPATRMRLQYEIGYRQEQRALAEPPDDYQPA